MSIAKLLSAAEKVQRDKVYADGITVHLRQPTHGTITNYGLLIHRGRGDEAVACLLKSSVIDEGGNPCLTDEQAQKLARAPEQLLEPILKSIYAMMPAAQKKADAPGADAVQDSDGAGAASE